MGYETIAAEVEPGSTFDSTSFVARRTERGAAGVKALPLRSDVVRDSHSTDVDSIRPLVFASGQPIEMGDLAEREREAVMCAPWRESGDCRMHHPSRR